MTSYGHQICTNRSALLAHLPDSAFTSSSRPHANHGPWLSRLNTSRVGERRGGWTTGSLNDLVSNNNKSYDVDEPNTRISFWEAERQCALRNARISVIETREQDTFISNLLSHSQREFWIDLSPPSQLCECSGLNATECETFRAGWKWRDGSITQYSAWKEDRPLGQSRQCAGKVNNDEELSWTDLHCSGDGSNT